MVVVQMTSVLHEVPDSPVVAAATAPLAVVLINTQQLPVQKLARAAPATLTSMAVALMVSLLLQGQIRYIGQLLITN